MSRAAGACLPVVADLRIDAHLSPRPANLSQPTNEATPLWFAGRNLPVKRENQAVIT